MEKINLTWRQRLMIWLRLGIRLVIVAIMLFLLSRFGGRVLDLTMPFLLGWLIAVLLDTPIRWTQGKLGCSRKFVSLAFIFGIVILVGGGVSLLVYYAGRELMDLLTNWDGLFDGIQSALD